MKVDIIIFGASGFTGQFVVEEIARIAAKTEGLTYAIAGRSESKLKSVLDKVHTWTDLNVENVPVYVADVLDAKSMSDMAAKGKILINCVGPYRFHGEKVVEACITAGTDYLDICGEPQFLEETHLKFNEAAQEKGLYVIGACAFDCIPAEMGTIFLRKNFPGDLKTVEIIVGSHPDSQSSPAVNTTTLECALHGYNNRNELRKIRKQLYQGGLPRKPSTMEKRGSVWWSDEAQRWCLQNMSADKSVVTLTQHLNYKQYQMQPIECECYFGIKSLLYVGIGSIFGFMFALMAPYKFTRNLMLNYPGIFTFGIFSKTGAEREELAKFKFSMTFVGRGTAEGAAEDAPRDKKAVAELSGPDPGYFGTSKLIIQCALCLLQERNNIPRAGVHTPGSAFLKTSLIDRLISNGFEFKMKTSENN